MLETKTTKSTTQIVNELNELLDSQYDKTIQYLTGCMLSEDSKRQEVVLKFLLNTSIKDRCSEIILDIITEIKKTVKKNLNINNNNNTSLLLNKYYTNISTFFEQTFLYIENNATVMLRISYERVRSDMKLLYLLFQEIVKIFPELKLINVSDHTKQNLIAYFALYDVDKSDNGVAKKLLCDSFNENYENNILLFKKIIHTLNKISIFGVDSILATFVLIYTFIDHILQRKYPRKPEIIQKILSETELDKLKPDEINNSDNKGKISFIYFLAVGIYHFCAYTDQSSNSMNTKIVGRRIRSAEELIQNQTTSIKNFKTYSIPTITTNIRIWTTENKDHLQNFIEKLMPLFFKQLLPLSPLSPSMQETNEKIPTDEVFISSFFNPGSNIEDRIKIGFEILSVSANNRILGDSITEYLSIVLRRPYKHINKKLYTWLTRLKELGFDYQPYYVEYMDNTFLSIEKLNLGRVLNIEGEAISDMTLKKIMAIREWWISDTNTDYMPRLKDTLIQEFGIKREFSPHLFFDENTLDLIFFLKKIGRSECLKIRKSCLQQAVNDRKIIMMSTERFFYEFILITLSQIYDKYKQSNHAIKSNPIMNIFPIDASDLTDDFLIRLEHFIESYDSSTAPSTLFKKTVSKFKELKEGKTIFFTKEFLLQLKKNSNFTLVTYVSQYVLDITSSSKEGFNHIQFFRDEVSHSENPVLIPREVQLQQVFVDQDGRLVWLKIIDGYLRVLPVDTALYRCHTKVGWALFTIKDGRLYLFSHDENAKKQEIHHSVIGIPLADGCGEVKIVGGVIIGLTFYSGHFPPSVNDCKRIVEFLKKYYPVSVSCTIHMRNKAKILRELDKLDLIELRSIEQSLAATYPLTLPEYEALIKDPVEQLKKGISRCVLVLSFLYRMIPQTIEGVRTIETFAARGQQGVIFNDSKGTKTFHFLIKNSLFELINKLNNIKIWYEVDVAEKLLEIFFKYDFKVEKEKSSFFTDHLYQIVKLIKESLERLDYVIFRPENLMGENLFIRLYDYADYIMQALNNTALIKKFPDKKYLHNLKEQSAFSTLFEYYEKIIKSSNDQLCLALLNELSINPFFFPTEKEFSKIQILRIVLCNSLYDFRINSNIDNKLIELSSYKELIELLQKTHDNIVAMLNEINTVLSSSDLETQTLRSLVNARLEQVKIYIGANVILPPHTDILERLIKEFNNIKSLASFA